MSDKTEYSMKVIGRNLRRLRRKNHLSVEEVRQHLGLGSVQAIYKYENGLSYPPLDKFLTMLELYEAQWQDVVRGSCGDEAGKEPTHHSGTTMIAVFELQRKMTCRYLDLLEDQINAWVCSHAGNNS